MATFFDLVEKYLQRFPKSLGLKYLVFEKNL